MQYHLKKLFSSLMAVFLVILLLPISVLADAETITILYTNDVHCGLEGYSKLAAYRNALLTAGENVILVDAGDHIQGELIGTMSQGEAIIEIMNEMGYEYSVPGNHEFDYKVPQFLNIMAKADFKYLSANFMKADRTKVMDAYAVKQIAGHKIGFVGISTPESYTKSTPVYFQDENGNYIYTFSEEIFYETIQQSINAAKADGAEVVVIIGHTGMDGSTPEWTTKSIIENTTGIDVYIDGHSHEAEAGPTYKGETFTDKDGKNVFYTQTGTKLANFGELTITFDTDIQINSTLHATADMSEKDQTIEDLILQARKVENDFSDTELGSSEVQLAAKKEDGSWLVRNQETNLGDFNADAYLWATGADIALMNAGGIRANVNAGTVIMKDLFSVNPWMNQVGVIEASGQTILDALEHGARLYPNSNGGFLQVAGLTYEINKKVQESPVIEAGKGEFSSVDDSKPRRIQNVLINGVPIDPQKMYRVAGTFYILQYSGDGMTMFKDCKVISGDYPSDAEVLVKYMQEKLNGLISAADYGDINGGGRIKVVDENRFVEVERVEPTHSAPGYSKLICEIDGTELIQEIPQLVYTVLEGDNSSWKDGEDILHFRIDGDETQLKEVWVDAALLRKDIDYTAKHGSTIIDLQTKFLQTLSNGEHMLRAVYHDGEVTTRFNVIKAVEGTVNQTVKTGDDHHMLIWILICGTSAVVLLIGFLYRRKRKQ